MNKNTPGTGVDSAGVNIQSAPSTSLCPLCCEVSLTESPTSSVTLSNCHHQSCRACLSKWIEREEATGQTTPPTCPFCRSTISENDVLTILGRPFKPREAGSNNNGSNNNGTEDIDDLTMQWINEHTVPCGVCGAFIEKHSGCDLMECLCGYRFCYSCGIAGGTCGCNGPRHGFLNNEYYIDAAPIRDERSGVVDLRSCIRRRTVRRERENNQKNRMQEEMRTWTFSETNAAICTVNGRWLFTPKKDTGCISMLVHQLSHGRIRRDRGAHVDSIQKRIFSMPQSQNQQILSESIDTPWLFLPKGADIRAMKQLIARDGIRLARWGALRKNRSRREWAPKTSLDVSWIFVRRGAEFRVLKQILFCGGYAGNQKRLQRKRFAFERMQNTSLETPWLFLSQGADTLVMKQYLAGESVRIIREYKKLEVKQEYNFDPGRDLNLVWLFLPTDVGMRILEGQNRAISRRVGRSKVRYADISFGATDDLINSGAWIFENSSPAASCCHLEKMFEQLREEC